MNDTAPPLDGPESFLESLRRFFAGRVKIYILLAAALLSASYLILSHSPRFNKSYSRTKQLAVKDGRFAFFLGSLITTAEVKQADIYFIFSQNIDTLEIFLSARTHPAAVKTGYPVTRLSDRRFKIAAKANLQDWLVDCTPQSPVQTLEVRVGVRPVFHVVTLLFQFLILFLIIVLILLTVLFGYYALTQRASDLRDVLRHSLGLFLLLTLTIYLYFILKIDSYLELWTLLEIPFLKILLSSALAAAFFGLVFFLHVRTRVKMILLPVLMSLLYLSVFPRYKIIFCGDGAQWIHLAADKARTIYFAEFMSYSMAKAANTLFNPGGSLEASIRFFSLDAKIIGVLFSLVLFLFVKAQKDLSSVNKSVFFLSASVLSLNALFLGHPEFSFYQIPFTILSVLSSMKYVSSGRGDKYLYLAVFFLTLAGLFHGSGYFSAPVLFILPFLREGQGRLDKKRILRLAKNYGVMVLIAAALILCVFIVTAVLGYSISFQNVRGGADNDRFADLFPSEDGNSWGERFLEMRYLWERGLGVFLAFPILFFPLIGKVRKWKGISSSDFVLFLFGFSQISVFFLWSYDLGFRDFDLIMAPWTVLNFLLMKIYLKTFNPDGKISKGVLFVSLFAVTSQAFFVLFWTTYLAPWKY